MGVEIWGYLISGFVSLVVCLINNAYQRKQTETLIVYRLDQLENSVSKHNNLIERMYKLEQDVAVHEERLSNIEKGGII